MILRAVSLLALPLLTASCGAEPKLSVANEPAPAVFPKVCPPEDDVCLTAKLASFSFGATFRGQLSDPYTGYRAACDRSDADGCFGLGTLYEMPEHITRDLPAIVLRRLKRDLVAAAEAYEKSCALGSALACATAANMIAKDGAALATVSVEKQVIYMDYLRRSCELGWAVSCSIYLEDSSRVSDEEWPGGGRVLYEHTRQVAAGVCATGDLDGCTHEGVSLILLGHSEGGTDEQANAGWQQIRDNCEAGNEWSCEIVRELGSD